MSHPAAVEFLRSFAQAISRMQLYEAGHPARDKAVREAHRVLLEALLELPEIPFSFVEGDVVLDEHRLRTMTGWEPGKKLAEAGIERMEFAAGVTRQEFESFLEDVLERVEASGAPPGPAEEAYPHIRYGRIAVGSQESEFEEVGLEEEAEGIQWLQQLAEGEGRVDTTVANAVVLSIGSAIRQSQNVLDLLVPLKETDQYSTAHSLNVSVLSIGLAEAMGFGGTDVRSMGEAAVLHDLGKTRIPEEILRKPDALTDEEWEIVRRHPEEGARILLQSDERLDLAALVAYEHHRMWSGGGYPEVRFSRKPHPVSQLIQICDVYDALRTQRPFRDPWPAEKIMRHIQEGAGYRFDPRAVEVFAKMIRRWELGESGEEGGSPGSDDGSPEPDSNGPSAPDPSAGEDAA